MPAVYRLPGGVRHQRASFRLHVALDAAARAAHAPVETLEGVNVALPGCRGFGPAGWRPESVPSWPFSAPTCLIINRVAG